MARLAIVIGGIAAAIVAASVGGVAVYRSEQARILGKHAVCESLQPEFAGYTTLAPIILIQRGTPSLETAITVAGDPARFENNPHAQTLAKVNQQMAREWERFPKDEPKMKDFARVRGYEICLTL